MVITAKDLRQDQDNSPSKVEEFLEDALWGIQRGVKSGEGIGTTSIRLPRQEWVPLIEKLLKEAGYKEVSSATTRESRSRSNTLVDVTRTTFSW